MNHKYEFFGLVLHSNLSLPGISSERATTEKCDVAVHLGLSPFSQESDIPASEDCSYESSETNDEGQPALQVWNIRGGGLVHMIYGDGTQFWLDRTHQNIWATWPGNLSLDDVTPYLFGPVLGLLLRFRRVTCLHASAVAFGDCCVAFVGWGGAGKSTTAAAFVRKGYRVLSDDIVALEEKKEGFDVLPAYPHLCLWPDSVKALYGSPEALPRFVPDWEKRRLSLGEEARFENRALPLRAVYILGERRPDPAPYSQKVSPQDALISLVTESYANKLLDRDLRAREFEVLGRLATKIPIRRVHANEDPARLGDLCRLILEDFSALGSPIRVHL